MLIRYSVTNLTHSTPAPHTHHSPHQIPVIQNDSLTQRENKSETRNRNLAAVNGVVIPSKVPSGQLPDQGQKPQDISHSLYSCSICGRKFNNKGNVKVHMYPCVSRNGNPNGVRWDDAWNDKVNPTGNSSQDLEYVDSRFLFQSVADSRTASGEDVDPEEEDKSQPVNSSGSSYLNAHPSRPSTSNLHQTTPAPSSMNSAPSRIPQQSHQPALSQTTPQNASPPSTMYDPNLRMDILSNAALLSMVRAWQDAAQRLGEEYTMDHPHFQRVMQELFERGIVDEDSNWLVDTA